MLSEYAFLFPLFSFSSLCVLTVWLKIRRLLSMLGCRPSGIWYIIWFIFYFILTLFLLTLFLFFVYSFVLLAVKSSCIESFLTIHPSKCTYKHLDDDSFWALVVVEGSCIICSLFPIKLSTEHINTLVVIFYYP